jgi:hypothetical protein
MREKVKFQTKRERTSLLEYEKGEVYEQFPGLSTSSGFLSHVQHS